MRTPLTLGIYIFLSLIAAGTSWGQDAKPATGTSGKKRTDINFEDQLIQGELRKPELFYLLQKKQINFGRLIRLRENFIPEMERNSNDVRRGGTTP
ncbi:MAG: hypothetical protein K2X47_13900 [Bdellovibrionales bacterium]|nr:hypothetical protein [Bdellovibrionales bacterium]